MPTLYRPRWDRGDVRPGWVGDDPRRGTNSFENWTEFDEIPDRTAHKRARRRVLCRLRLPIVHTQWASIFLLLLCIPIAWHRPTDWVLKGGKEIGWLA